MPTHTTTDFSVLTLQIDQLGSVRWGNPHLDFEICISDFAIEHDIRPHGGFQLRNPNPDFMDFFLPFNREIKKDLQNYSHEQWSSLC